MINVMGPAQSEENANTMKSVQKEEMEMQTVSVGIQTDSFLIVNWGVRIWIVSKVVEYVFKLILELLNVHVLMATAIIPIVKKFSVTAQVMQIVLL